MTRRLLWQWRTRSCPTSGLWPLLRGFSEPDLCHMYSRALQGARQSQDKRGTRCEAGVLELDVWRESQTAVCEIVGRMQAKLLRSSARHIACRKHLLRSLAQRAARSMPQLCLAKLDGLARRVADCNEVAGRDTFVPWSADGAIGGYLRPE